MKKCALQHPGISVTKPSARFGPKRQWLDKQHKGNRKVVASVFRGRSF